MDEWNVLRHAGPETAIKAGHNQEHGLHHYRRKQKQVDGEAAGITKNNWEEACPKSNGVEEVDEHREGDRPHLV